MAAITHEYNGILAAAYPTAVIENVTVAQGAAELPVGTVLVMGDGGTYAQCDAALDGDAIVAVLAEPVAAGAGTAYAEAYVSGCFNRSKLAAGGTPSGSGATAYTTLTAADFGYLRQAGIHSKTVISC